MTPCLYLHIVKKGGGYGVGKNFGSDKSLDDVNIGASLGTAKHQGYTLGFVS